MKIFWVDCVGNVREGTKVEGNDRYIVVKTGNEYATKNKSEVFDSKANALATAAKNLMADAAVKQRKAVEHLNELAELGKPQAAEAAK